MIITMGSSCGFTVWEKRRVELKNSQQSYGNNNKVITKFLMSEKSKYVWCVFS